MPWVGQVLHRSRQLFWLKTLGLTVFMTVFFMGYFHVLRHPVNPVTLMPLTPLDHAIGFQPAALGIYLSLWFYVGIAPYLLDRLRALVAYGLWIGALCLFGLGLFYAWPTAVPAPLTDLTVYPGFGLLQGVDAAGNACPSLHVATAMFTAVWIDRLLGDMSAGAPARTANWIWLVLIAYSTLATKQHVLLDVVAGALLGLAFAVPSLGSWAGILRRRDIDRGH